MTRVLTQPLVPFVDPLPVPPRLLAPQHGGRLTVAIRAGAHRFHRDLNRAGFGVEAGQRQCRLIAVTRLSPYGVQ